MLHHVKLSARQAVATNRLFRAVLPTWCHDLILQNKRSETYEKNHKAYPTSALWKHLHVVFAGLDLVMASPMRSPGFGDSRAQTALAQEREWAFTVRVAGKQALGTQTVMGYLAAK